MAGNKIANRISNFNLLNEYSYSNLIFIFWQS